MEIKQYPEPACGALIFNSKGELFLMKSPKWHGKYVIPGGHIELGEKISDTVKREIKEETNLDINNVQFLCIQEAIFSRHFHAKKHFVLLDFVCKAKKASSVKLNKEGSSYVWVSPKDALKLDVEPFTVKSILTYLKKISEFK